MLKKEHAVEDLWHFALVHVSVEELDLNDHLNLGRKFENLQHARGLSDVEKICAHFLS